MFTMTHVRMRYRALFALLLLLGAFAGVRAQAPAGGLPVTQGSAAPGASQAPPPSAATGRDPGTAVIRGRIVRAGDGQPVPAARVGSFSRMAIAGDDGRYEIEGLQAGRYEVAASSTGFVTTWYGQRLPGQSRRLVEVRAGEVVSDIDIVLQRAAAIAGVVLDEDGEPLEAVPVWLLQPRFANGERRLEAVLGTAVAGVANAADVTDDLGHFRLFGLRPGTYYLAAGLPGRPETSTRATRQGQNVATPTLYPGTLTLAGAQLITVAEGDELAGLSFVVAPIGTATILGTVLATPASSERTRMTLVHHGIAGDVSSTASVRPDGGFAIANLPPGDYTLFAESGDQSGVARTTLGQDDVTVALTMRRGFTIRGRLIFEGGPPSAGTSSAIAWRAIEWPARKQATMAGDWTFHATGVTGSQRLVVGVEGWMLKQVRRSGVDVTDAVMVIDEDEHDLEITMTRDVPVLTGEVRDARGAPALGATVVVFAEDRERWWPGTRYIRTAQPDRDGRFLLTSLPPGRYIAVAVEELPSGDQTDPEVLATLTRVGTRVELRAGETRALVLREVRR